MKILAIIPARGGSKRLPGKNIRPLGGRPLIAWSIDAAKQVSALDEVLVSTDDPEIAAVASAAGALVPWLRPADLSTDTASSVDVCLHACAWYEATRGKLDGLLLLQPTTPFRRVESIERGLHLFREYGRQAVVGVSPAKCHPLWCVKIDNGIVHPFISGGAFNIRSQELPPAYVVNGALYLIAPAELKSSRTFLPSETRPLVIEGPEECIDIDTEADWKMAVTYLREP